MHHLQFPDIWALRSKSGGSPGPAGGRWWPTGTQWLRGWEPLPSSSARSLFPRDALQVAGGVSSRSPAASRRTVVLRSDETLRIRTGLPGRFLRSHVSSDRSGRCSGHSLWLRLTRSARSQAGRASRVVALSPAVATRFPVCDFLWAVYAGWQSKKRK